MSPRRLLVLALLLAGCSSRRARPCPAPAQEAVPAAEATVAAKRYRTWIVDSACDWVHGGGRPIEELWFPEQGVVANVTRGYALDAKPVLHAFPSEMRASSQPGPNAPSVTSPVEDVRVPAALAREIFAAADLRRRLQAAQDALGPRLEATGLLREVPHGQ
jgi:hypothetical protein